eukprot:gene54260-49038_t
MMRCPAVVAVPAGVELTDDAEADVAAAVAGECQPAQQLSKPLTL